MLASANLMASISATRGGKGSGRVDRAMDAPAPAPATPTLQRRILLSGSLGVLMASLEMLQRYSQGIQKETYSIAVAVCLSETLKTLVSGYCIWHSKKHSLYEVAADSGRMATPALIYFAQNALGYWIFWSGLTAFEASVIIQAKILITALLSRCILNRKLEMRKWRALSSMTLGGIFVVRQNMPSNSANTVSSLESNTRQPIVGVLLELVSCFTSGLAGVLMEREYKSKEQAAAEEKARKEAPELPQSQGNQQTQVQEDASSKLLHVSIKNFQLGICSLACSVMAVLVFDLQRLASGNLFDGVSPTMCAISALMAFTGLYVGLVIHELDIIWKNIGAIFQIIIATCASVIVYGDILSFDFIVATPIIMIAVVEYATE